MSLLDYTNSLLSLINLARSEDNLLELIELSPDDVNYAYFTDCRVYLSAEDIQEGSSNVENVTSAVKTMLSTDGAERDAMMDKWVCSYLIWLRLNNYFFTYYWCMLTDWLYTYSVYRFANYFSIEVTEDNGNVEAILKIFNKYIAMEEIGPFIDGSLVLQMTSHNPQELIPAICTVDYAADSDETFETIATILPWQMIYTPPDDDLPDSCVIPISLDPQYCEGSVRIKVFVCPPELAPHKEEVEGYRPEWSQMVPSVSLQVSTKGAEQDQTAQDLNLTYPTVLSLKVSSAPDAESALTQEGLQVGKVDLLKGFNEAPESGSWKFHVGVKTGGMEAEGEGVEDVVFVKKEKGTEFDIPEGFTLDPTNILSQTDGESTMVSISEDRSYSNVSFSKFCTLMCPDIFERFQ